MLYPEFSLAVGTVLGSTAAAILTTALAESGLTEPEQTPTAGQLPSRLVSTPAGQECGADAERTRS